MKYIKRAFGTYEIAEICQVTPPTVGRWIEAGKLPSFITAGGHRRVWAKDLILFLKAHNLPVPPEMQAAQGPLRILVVDDEEAVRRTILRILRGSYPEADIQEAADGFEAGHKVSAFLPALVLLDFKLPGMDGFRVCRLIRQDPRLSGIKILVMSGHNLPEFHSKALEAGADDFLGKPFSPENLLEKIGALIPK